MKRNLTRLKILPGLLVFAGAFGVGYLSAFYSGLSGPPAEVSSASGLKYIDLVEGHGPMPRPGQRITVHYKGLFENGREFENSYGHGRPVSFTLGFGHLIHGWEEGLVTMKVGGKRRLIIPPHLAYGATGSPSKIPPHATLIFEVELLEVE